MGNYAYVIWIPLLPLLSFIVLGLFGRKYVRTAAGILGTLALLGSTVLSLVAARQYFFIGGKLGDVYQQITAFKFEWLHFSQTVSIDMSMIIDPISVMMLVVVSFV